MIEKFRNIAVVGVVFIAVAGWLAYTNRSIPVQVSVVRATVGEIEQTVANTRAGTVQACRRAKMAPAAGGQIAQLPVSKGAVVKQGDLLLALWNVDLQAQVALASSEARAAQARAKSVCVQAENAQRNATRKTSLRKTNVVSEEEVEQVVALAKSSQADCEASHASAKVSAENINLANAYLARTQLRAPFDGVVVEVHGEIGEYVTPSPPGIATLPAIDIVDRSCFYVTAPIDEVDAPKIRAAMPARITLDAFKDQQFAARVRRIADYVLDLEKQARTVDIEVSFDDPQDTLALLPGYSADAEVIIRTRDNVVQVPTEAVIAKKQVYVFDEQSALLELRDVQIGLTNWDQSEIITGVQPGEWIVTSVDRKGIGDGVKAQLEQTD